MAMPALPLNIPLFSSHFRPTEADEKALGALSIIPPEERLMVLELPYSIRKEVLKILKARFRTRLYNRAYMRMY
ncbi:MAG: hypothetical protein P8P30_08655, partial [Rickettsiales bacterium]|nr:hypothetical protein [Rickettsiales bacterium]